MFGVVGNEKWMFSSWIWDLSKAQSTTPTYNADRSCRDLRVGNFHNFAFETQQEQTDWLLSVS